MMAASAPSASSAKRSRSRCSFFAFAVGDAGHVEAQVLQQALDCLGIAAGIGERGEVLVFRLADDERHAAQRLLLRRSGKDQSQQEYDGEAGEAHHGILRRFGFGRRQI